eukprot:g3544.t1
MENLALMSSDVETLNQLFAEDNKLLENKNGNQNSYYSDSNFGQAHFNKNNRVASRPPPPSVKQDVLDDTSDESDGETLEQLLQKRREMKKRQREDRNKRNIKRKKTSSTEENECPNSNTEIQRRGTKQRMLSFLEKEKPEVLFKVGTKVLAKWEDKFLPATVRIVDNDSEEGLTFSVTWDSDGSITDGITADELKLPNRTRGDERSDSVVKKQMQSTGKGNEKNMKQNADGEEGGVKPVSPAPTTDGYSHTRNLRKSAVNRSLRLFAGIESDEEENNHNEKTFIIKKGEKKEIPPPVQYPKVDTTFEYELKLPVGPNNKVNDRFWEGLELYDRMIVEEYCYKVCAVKGFNMSKLAKKQNVGIGSICGIFVCESNSTNATQINAGDAILSINGQTCSSIPAEHILKLLKGAEGISFEKDGLNSQKVDSSLEKFVVLRMLRSCAVKEALEPCLLTLCVPTSVKESGALLQFTNPHSGITMQVNVPEGNGPGSSFSVAAPSNTYVNFPALPEEQIFIPKL